MKNIWTRYKYRVTALYFLFECNEPVETFAAIIPARLVMEVFSLRCYNETCKEGRIRNGGLKMRDQRQETLLRLLKTNAYVTAERLGAGLNVSEKTVRNLMKSLAEDLSGHGAYIEAKSRLGYRLVIKEPGLFQNFLESFSTDSAFRQIPNTSEERIEYLLGCLLEADDYLKMDDLSDRLYVSKKTLAADIKEVERILGDYHLTLTRKPYYGIRVEGKEFDLRLCIAHHGQRGRFAYLLEPDTGEKQELNRIAACTAKCLKEFDFSLSDVAFQNLIVHLYVAMERMREDCYVPFEDKQLERLKKRKEFMIAQELVRRLNEQNNTKFSESEVGYVTIHLAGKMSYEGGEQEGENLVISPEISAIADEMVKTVYGAFQYDFRDDLELKMSLCQHLVPLKIRIEYDMALENPIRENIMEHFPMASAMARQAVSVISRTYGKKLSEDEVAYFALPFALALERQKTQIVKKNILLVCSSGKGSAELLRYKYKRELGEYLNRIETCEVNKIDRVDFKDINYVFTTVPIPVKIPVPILEVKYFLESEDIRQAKKALSESGEGTAKRYYARDLFLPHVSGGSREEVLDKLCRHVRSVREIPEELYESVMLREQLAKTEFGNRVAMPHPYRAMSKETCVCVAVLDHPVLWGEQEVQVVFLVLIEKGKNKDLQKFYQVTSHFLLEERYIKDLIKKRDYDEFIRVLNQVEKEVEQIDG